MTQTLRCRNVRIVSPTFPDELKIGSDDAGQI